MLRELGGAPKPKETLGSLLRAIWGLMCGLPGRCFAPAAVAGSGRCGAAIVSFGKPICLKPYLRVSVMGGTVGVWRRVG